MGYSREAIYGSSDQAALGTRRHIVRQRGMQWEQTGGKWRVELEYFEILLCELWIYCDQTTWDCRKTNQDCLAEFVLVYVQFDWLFLGWVDKTINFDLIW